MGVPREPWNPGHEIVRLEAVAKEAEREVVLEPMVWGLFSLGGFITAFLLPVTIFFLSLAVPLGLWPAERIGYGAFAARFPDLLVRLFFLVVIGGGLFHGMHRLRHILLDAGLTRADTLWAVLCYGVAVFGTLAAVYYTFLEPTFGWSLPFL